MWRLTIGGEIWPHSTFFQNCSWNKMTGEKCMEWKNTHTHTLICILAEMKLRTLLFIKIRRSVLTALADFVRARIFD